MASNAKFCSQCANPLPEPNPPFCSQCGAQLSPSSTEASSQEDITEIPHNTEPDSGSNCAMCGMELGDTRYCDTCGAPNPTYTGSQTTLFEQERQAHEHLGQPQQNNPSDNAFIRFLGMEDLGFWGIAFLIASVIMPLIGIIAGIVYVIKSHKRFGVRLIVISVVSWVIWGAVCSSSYTPIEQNLESESPACLQAKEMRDSLPQGTLEYAPMAYMEAEKYVAFQCNY